MRRSFQTQSSSRLELESTVVPKVAMKLLEGRSLKVNNQPPGPDLNLGSSQGEMEHFHARFLSANARRRGRHFRCHRKKNLFSFVLRKAGKVGQPVANVNGGVKKKREPSAGHRRCISFHPPRKTLHYEPFLFPFSILVFAYLKSSAFQPAIFKHTHYHQKESTKPPKWVTRRRAILT